MNQIHSVNWENADTPVITYRWAIRYFMRSILRIYNLELHLRETL